MESIASRQVDTRASGIGSIGNSSQVGHAYRHRIERGRLVSSIELNHISFILYRVPLERVRVDLPANAVPVTTTVAGVEMAWVSVISCVDRALGSAESTSYQLHITDGGRPARLILGVSIGSLSSVGARNLWQMPWHLGAMELRASFDTRQNRYTDYRLQTQSQWESACWDIADSGKVLDEESRREIGVPVEVLSEKVRLIYGRAGQAADRAAVMDITCADQVMTRAEIRTARSEFLEKSGLLTREELESPVMVGLQQCGSLVISTTPIDRRNIPNNLKGSPGLPLQVAALAI